MRRLGDIKGAVGCYVEAVDLLAGSIAEGNILLDEDEETENKDEDEEDEEDEEDDRITQEEAEDILLQMYQYCSEVGAPIMSETYIPRRTSPQDFDRVQSLSSSVLRARSTLLGDDHPDTLASMHQVILLSCSIGQWGEAIPLARKYIQLSVSPAHLRREEDDIKRTLAMMLRELDEPEKQEAQTLLEQVHLSRSQTLGASHEKTTQSMVDLIEVMESLDRMEEAIDALNPFIRLVSSRLGDTDHSTLLCRSALAFLLVNAGREDDASELVKKLNEVFEQAKKSRPLRRATLRAMANCARVLVELETEDADSAFEDVLELQSSSLSEDHPDALAIREEYASYLQSLGEVERALNIREDITEARRRSLGNKHPYTLRAMFETASCLGALSRFNEAKSLLEDVIEGYGNALGRSSTRYVESLQALGLILVQLGELYRARSIHEQVLQLITTKYGEKDERTIAAMVSLAGVIWSSGQETEGLAMEVKAVELQREVLGDKHPTTLQTMHNHAVTLQSIGRYGTSLAILKEAHKGRKDVLGEAHSLTVASLYSLAVSLEGLGENEEAIKTVREVVKLAETSARDGGMGEEEVEEYRDALEGMEKEFDLFQRKVGGLKAQYAN